jgi:hypothetical protein
MPTANIGFKCGPLIVCAIIICRKNINTINYQGLIRLEGFRHSYLKTKETVIRNIENFISSNQIIVECTIGTEKLTTMR